MRPAALLALNLMIVKTLALKWTLEAENAPGHYISNYRSEASGKKTVRLAEGEALVFPVCLMTETKLTVQDVIFSNDGLSDNVTISLDSVPLGSFTSMSNTNNGKLWNVFHSTGPLNDIIIGSGMHRLDIRAINADFLGVEIDKIIVEVDDNYLNADIYSCSLPCVQETPPLTGPIVGPVSEGYIKQRSYPTNCAEEDNIYIPVFHNSVKKYIIAARLPAYHSFKNERSPDFQDCTFNSNMYWNFTKIAFSDLMKSVHFTSQQSVMSLRSKCVNIDGTQTLQIGVVFPLKGPSKGLVDSEMGSNIKLTLSGVSKQVEVVLLYKMHTGAYVTKSPVKLFNSSFSHSWHIPDFSWTEGDNDVIIKVINANSENIMIEEFYNSRRRTTGDQLFHIYSGNIIIDGLTVDFWWRAKESMEISLTTTNQTWTAHYIQVYVPIPWSSGSWCQVMVLYQDGNVRLLPITPEGLDWIPFGTSVILGQNDQSIRPSAPIAKLNINPATMTLNIIYNDGGSATMVLFPLLGRTELHLFNLNLVRDTKANPFATFRSMYVKGGITDSDSVSSNIVGPKHVMDSWGTMTGSTFGVFRRCQSKHNTQSPDLYLGIIDA